MLNYNRGDTIMGPGIPPALPQSDLARKTEILSHETEHGDVQTAAAHESVPYPELPVTQTQLFPQGSPIQARRYSDVEASISP